MSLHSAVASAAASPVSILSKQPATERPGVPASPGFQKSTPPPAAKTVLTPLALGSGKTPFNPAATSPLTSFADRAVRSSPLASLTPKALQTHKPPLPAFRSTAQAGTNKAMSMSSLQQHSAQPSTGMFNLIPKPGVSSLMKSSRDSNGQQTGGKSVTALSPKPMSLSQRPPKPASKNAGTFPSLFKQPVRTSSGSTPPAVPSPAGLASLQAGAQASFPAQSSKAAGLPEDPVTSRTIGLTRAAATLPVTPHGPVTKAAALPSHGAPSPGQGIHTTSGHTMPESPCIGKQVAKPSEQPLQSRGPSALDVQTHADTRPAAPNAPGNGGTDMVVDEEMQGRQVHPQTWTSTSLAAGLMGNMKSLEEVSHTPALACRSCRSCFC